MCNYKRILTRLGVILLIGVFLTGCMTSNLREFSKLPPPSGSHPLQVGDPIIVELQNISQVNRSRYELRIDDQGAISLPLIGKVKAVGLTESALAEIIKMTYIERKFYSTLDVSVIPPQRSITVGGRVKRPGIIPYTDDLTLNAAIQQAGGYDIFAKREKVMVVRDGKAYPVNGKAAEQGRYNPKLYPGDEVHVERSSH